MSDALPQTLDVLLRGLEDGLHLGAALYVSLGGKEVSHIVLAEAEPGRLLTHDASIPWLSAGKPQTAAGIAWLWERKLIRLDQPVRFFLPTFTGGGKDEITLRHCLTHTAGLRAAISAWTRQTQAQILETLSAASVELGWVPGKSAGYHVASTWYLLGAVIEAVTQKPLNEFLRTALWNPLGMSHTSLTFTEAEWEAMAGGRMVMHDTSKSHAIRSEAGTALRANSGVPTPMSWDGFETYTIPRPASGIRGSIRDLGTFYEFMLADGLAGSSASASPPLSHTTRAAMSARHRVGIVDQTFKAKIDTGLGFLCESSHYNQGAVPYQFGPYASPRTFGHGGNQSSVGMADPEHNLVVALAFNGMPGDPRHDKRLRESLAAIYQDLGLAPSLRVG